MILSEELFEDDLDGMLTNIISVDEFESKITEDAIVIAFYSKNEQAAEDLAIFLERSSIENILDSEVSNTPNENAEYLIFVEINKNNFIETFNEVLNLVHKLNKIEDWKLKNIRLASKLIPLTDKNLNILYKKIRREQNE